MRDAKLIEKLRLIERELDNYLWYQEAGLGDAIREAIERLTPGKMTLEGCCLVLNENEYSYAGPGYWTKDYPWKVDGDCISDEDYTLTLFEANCLAWGFLSQKGEANV